MKNIYSYTNTEINKMKRQELLKLKYEQDKNYFEKVNGSNPNWSKENPFDKYAESMKCFTVKDLRENLKWRQEEIEKFLDQPKRSSLERQPWTGRRGSDDGRPDEERRGLKYEKKDI